MFWPVIVAHEPRAVHRQVRSEPRDDDGGEAVGREVGDVELTQRHLLADVVKRLFVKSCTDALRVLVHASQRDAVHGGRIHRQAQRVLRRRVESAERFDWPFRASTLRGRRPGCRGPRRIEIQRFSREGERTGAFAEHRESGVVLDRVRDAEWRRPVVEVVRPEARIEPPVEASAACCR